VGICIFVTFLTPDEFEHHSKLKLVIGLLALSYVNLLYVVKHDIRNNWMCDQI